MADDWRRQIDRLHEKLVRRDDPAAWVTEADAVDASRRYPHLAFRGPVFGVAARGPEADAPWRLVQQVSDATPQQARDGLNSLLWFKAKDDTDDPGVRRELLAAVGVLEREPANEVTALGVRYRVVRGDEFARSGDSGLEPPRATDLDPAAPSWDERVRPPASDPGFVLDPGKDVGFTAGTLQMILRGFAYSGTRYPDDVREDSERAVTTHPDVVLLPVGFGVAERRGAGWRPHAALMPTPHHARRVLYDGLAELWPKLYELDERERERYARAAEEFRAAGRADEARVGDQVFRICRIQRMVRFGPDGPEPPRPSDHDEYGPMKIHPTLGEDGTIRYGSDDGDGDGDE